MFDDFRTLIAGESACFGLKIMENQRFTIHKVGFSPLPGEFTGGMVLLTIIINMNIMLILMVLILVILVKADVVMVVTLVIQMIQ